MWQIDAAIAVYSLATSRTERKLLLIGHLEDGLETVVLIGAHQKKLATHGPCLPACLPALVVSERLRANPRPLPSSLPTRRGGHFIS